MMEEFTESQIPNKRHQISPDLVYEQVCCKLRELTRERDRDYKAAFANRADYEAHPERWAEEPSTPEQITKAYDECIAQERDYYSTVRVIERPDGNKRFILVYGDVDDRFVIDGTGPFESFIDAQAWYLYGGR